MFLSFFVCSCEAIRLATDYLQDRIFERVRLNLSVSVYLGYSINDVYDISLHCHRFLFTELVSSHTKLV